MLLHAAIDAETVTNADRSFQSAPSHRCRSAVAVSDEQRVVVKAINSETGSGYTHAKCRVALAPRGQCMCLYNTVYGSVKSSQSGVSTGGLKDVDRGASVTRHSEVSGCVCQTNIDRAQVTIFYSSLFTHFFLATSSHANNIFTVLCILNCLRCADLPTCAHPRLSAYLCDVIR